MAELAAASGAALADADLRRRNVPAAAQNGHANGNGHVNGNGNGSTHTIEIDNKKLQAKKVGSRYAAALRCADKRLANHTTSRSGVLGRMGVSYCASDLHSSLLLHASMEDWSLSDCYLG